MWLAGEKIGCVESLYSKGSGSRTSVLLLLPSTVGTVLRRASQPCLLIAVGRVVETTIVALIVSCLYPSSGKRAQACRARRGSSPPYWCEGDAGVEGGLSAQLDAVEQVMSLPLNKMSSRGWSAVNPIIAARPRK